MDKSPIPLPLTQSRAAILSGHLSPLDLTESLLRRIEQLNPKLNAYLEIAAESALAEARKATEAIAHKQPFGPLHGIPIALKDLFDVRGMKTRAGSPILRDNVAAEDSFVARRLREAGAIFLGKLNLHEWALGTTSVNPHFGAVRNPWNADYITGGSSGGSAAALMAGLCLGSVGTDTGGSIRIPSSLCGCVGLKPTYGRVSLRGVVPLSWSLDHAGPMARTVEDVALLLQVVAGYDEGDPASEKGLEIGDWRLRVRDLRVGVPDDPFFFSELHPETERAVKTAIEVIRGLVSDVPEVSLAGHAAAAAAAGKILLAEAAAFHRDHMRDQPELIGEDVLTRFRWGTEVSVTDLALAYRAKAEWRRKLEKVFEAVDAIVLPATPFPALPIDDADALASARLLTRFTRVFNLSGSPALVLPCGFTTSGLPLGLQIVGPRWGEAKVLAIGHAYEQATEWHKRVASDGWRDFQRLK